MTFPVILDFIIFFNLSYFFYLYYICIYVELFNLEIPLTNIDLLIEYFKAEHY